MKIKQFRNLKAGDIVKVKYSSETHDFLVLVKGNRCLGKQWNNAYEARGIILSSKVYREGIGWYLAEDQCVSYELII